MSKDIFLRVDDAMGQSLNRSAIAFADGIGEVITLQDYIRTVLHDHQQEVDPLYTGQPGDTEPANV
jgi:hypothetical protein